MVNNFNVIDAPHLGKSIFEVAVITLELSNDALEFTVKISMLCQPSELKWNANQLEMLINSSFPEWSKEGKRELLEITLPAMSPGVIVHLPNDIRIHKMRGINDFCR